MTTLSCPPPSGGSGDGPAPRLASSATRVAALVGAGTLAGLFLAACGGDSETPAAPAAAATEVPTSAAASPAALEAFALAQPKTENTEPLLLDNVPTFPTTEVDDPIVVP